MQNQQILITFPTTPEEMDALRAAAPGAEFFFVPQKQVSREDVLRADVILGAPPLKFLRENDHLALLALSRAGSADVCEPGVLPEHTVLTNATGAYGIIISEWMIGMLLNIYNHFALYRAQQSAGPVAKAVPATAFDLWRAGAHRGRRQHRQRVRQARQGDGRRDRGCAPLCRAGRSGI